MKAVQLLSFTLAFLSGVSLFADQIVLKNGDRLTGTITKSDDKTLLIKTDYAGDVTVQWPAVQQLTSTQPLHVVLQGGKTVSGPVGIEDGNLEIATASGAPVKAAASEVTSMRDNQEQAAYEKSLHPTLFHGWTVGAAVGFGLTAGNSETQNLALAFNADRPTKTDEIKMYATSAYATNNAPGATPSVTANTIQAGARYSHNLTSRTFAYGEGDFQTDALQTLDLRSIFTGGLGIHVIKSAKTTFDLQAGGGYTHEKYDAYSDSFAVLSVGELLTQKLGLGTVITESANYLPDMSDTSQYQANFSLGTVTKISKWLGWQNSFGDIYVTNPPVDTKRNDLVLTTGLNIAFTR
jgi:putative salt-induced outer membrane protein YdiY